MQVPVLVSGDERYELYLDGDLLVRGPERGNRLHWYTAEYTLALSAGEHVLAARVWALGAQANCAQLSVNPGFVLIAGGDSREMLSTGVAPWRMKSLSGYECIPAGECWGRGSNIRFDGRRYDWGFSSPSLAGWEPATLQHAAVVKSRYGEFPTNTHILCRPALPMMKSALHQDFRVRYADSRQAGMTQEARLMPGHHQAQLANKWQSLLADGRPLTVPADSSQRILVDLTDYLCAYPCLTLSAGRDAEVTINFAESLFMSSDCPEAAKDNRDATDYRYFKGWGDVFVSGGGEEEHHTSLWWHAGRYMEILIRTGAERLRVERLQLQETHYPVVWESSFNYDKPHMQAIIPLMRRALMMCMHETYMDCPYYEQMMYTGDTRTEALATYTSMRDARLPRKSIQQMADSALPSGPTLSRYPSRLWQLIPPFSLWWIGMVYDYALWRGEKSFVLQMLPRVRNILDYFLGHIQPNGLANSPSGWNFVDWVKEWSVGIPIEGDCGQSGVINWQLVLGLEMAAELEDWAQEPEMAARWRRRSGELVDALRRERWSAERSLFAENASRTQWSEHSNALALLSGRLSPVEEEQLERGLVQAPDLLRTTIYFSHYLLEAFYRRGLGNAILKRLQLWFDLPAQGFKTTPESPEPSRSDCHAWGAHPLYHYYASILGVRPASFGFETVQISPCLGDLSEASGVLPHPKGEIRVAYQRKDNGLTVRLTLPSCVSGVWIYQGTTRSIQTGEQEFFLRSLPWDYTNCCK